VRFARLARTGYGAALLVAPGRVVRTFGGDPADGITVAAARILGARHLLQALVTGRNQGPVRRVGGAFMDATHAVSMFALAKADSVRRRPALIDGAAATAFFAAGLLSGVDRPTSATR